MAVINDYPEGSEIYELADPKVEEDYYGGHVFYQSFFGADAAAAKAAVEAFLSETKEDGDSILLLRKEPGRLFTFSHGHICVGLLNRQEELRSLISDPSNKSPEAFLLPLKRYMHRCPGLRPQDAAFPKQISNLRRMRLGR